MSNSKDVRADLLLFPGGNSTELPELSDVRATVGGRRYSVDSIRKVGHIRKVVVFDFSSIQAQDVECLHEQMESFILRPELDVDVFAVGCCGNAYRFKDGQGVYVLPDWKPPPKDKCKNPSHDRLQKVVETTGFGFASLLSELWGSKGPVQVVWVGQDFGWGAQGHTLLPESTYVPSWVSFVPDWMPYVTGLGLSVFPVVWTRPGSTGDAVQKRSREEAAVTAQYFGGESTECQGDIEPCLRTVLARGASAWLIGVIGPAIEGRSEGRLPELKIQIGSEKEAYLRRAFSVPADQSGPFPYSPKPGVFPETETPLYSVGLAVQMGCRTTPGSQSTLPSMTVYIPRTIIGLGGADLDLYISPYSPDGVGSAKGMKTRAVVTVKTDDRSSGPGEVCLTLPSVEGSMQLVIVLYNQKLHWAGKIRIGKER
jgi:hypothetical protein